METLLAVVVWYRGVVSIANVGQFHLVTTVPGGGSRPPALRPLRARLRRRRHRRDRATDAPYAPAGG